MIPRAPAAIFIALAAVPCLLLYNLWPTSWLFLPDDAYYYLRIARNLASGLGSTFDQLGATNGYHPAWQGLAALLALALPDRADLVRAALTLCCLLAALGFWWGLKLLWPRPTPSQGLIAGLASMALFWNFHLSKAVINGMESALLLASLSGFLLLFGRWLTGPAPPGPIRSLLLGLAACLVIAARLDTVFLVPAGALTWLLVRGLKARDLPGLALFLATPLIGLGLYLALNQHFFGLAWPVSGLVKRSLAGWVVPPAWPILGAVSLLTVGWLAAQGRRVVRPADPARAGLTCLSLFLLFRQIDASLAFQYNLPLIWTMAPWVLWAWLVLCRGAARLLESGARWWKPAGLAAGCLALAGAVAFSWAARLDPASYAHYAAARRAAAWIEAELPPRTVLAGWSVGLVGYFSGRRVMNLDGLVNTPDFARTLIKGESALKYLDRHGVGYLVYYQAPGASLSRPGFPAAELALRLGEPALRLAVVFRAWGLAPLRGTPPTLRYEYLVTPYGPAVPAPPPGRAAPVPGHGPPPPG